MNGLQNQGRCGKAPKRLCLLIVCALWTRTGLSLAATPVPTINESRTYSHPAPGADTFFGPIVDISSKYVGVLGRRGTTSIATEYDAFIFDAATGQHLWTLSQPVPSNNNNFRFASLAIDGNLAVIGATYAHVPLAGGGTAFNAGAAYVYDLTTGLLKYKLVSNTPQNNFLLGSSVDILGNRIVVGSWGNAYVFDATTGAQLAKLNPSTPSEQFGVSVALSESAVVAGSNSDTSRGSFTGAAFAFNAQTFAQISKFVPDNTVAFDNFGINVAVDGHYAIGSSTAGAYVFDVTTGTQLRKLNLPGSTNYLDLLDIQGTTALLGNPVLGRAMMFDWTTGTALQELVPSDFSSNLQFGSSVALTVNTAIVGAVGKAYEFHVVPEPSGAAMLLVGLLVATVLAQPPLDGRKRR